MIDGDGFCRPELEDTERKTFRHRAEYRLTSYFLLITNVSIPSVCTCDVRSTRHRGTPFKQEQLLMRDMDNQDPPDKSELLSRRSFARNTLGAAAVVLLPASEIKAEGAAAQATAAKTAGKPEGLSDSDWSEVQSKYANLLRVYGQRLSEEEKSRALTILTTNQHMLASIRLFEVQNGDPSACTLRV